MILSDIITRVQRQFGDDVQAQITTDDIVRWVNDACLEIVTNNRTNQGTYVGQTPIVAGQKTYELPPDLYLIRAVRANGKVVRASTYEQLVNSVQGNLSDTNDPALGYPEYYWVLDYKLSMYPLPSESMGTLDIIYIKRPDVMTAEMLTRQPDVPVEYHPRIVEYCIAQAAELDDNIGQYQLKMQEFQSNMSKLRENGEQPEGDGAYPYITYVSEWG